MKMLQREYNNTADAQAYLEAKADESVDEDRSYESSAVAAPGTKCNLGEAREKYFNDIQS
jgi:hypothetical protein